MVFLASWTEIVTLYMAGETEMGWEVEDDVHAPISFFQEASDRDGIIADLGWVSAVHHVSVSTSGVILLGSLSGDQAQPHVDDAQFCPRFVCRAEMWP
jgi:hypothetical protein